MVARFAFSLTAFSLLLALPVFAEEEEALIEEEAEITEIVAEPAVEAEIQRALFSKKTEEKKTEPKKQKPHHVGVRKPEVKDPAEQKKSSKVKNEWFISKTHPKGDKKEIAKKEEAQSSEKSSGGHPFFNRGAPAPAAAPQTAPKAAENKKSAEAKAAVPAATTTTIAAPAVLADTFGAKQPETPGAGNEYPKGGFQAPRGHIFFTGDWLYWVAREEGMEYVPGHNVNFDFKSGYRVGFGVHLPLDYWDIYANYTDFRPQHTANASGSFYPLFLFAGSTAANASANWKINFQSADLELGRSFYMSKALVLRPFFGMKGAWIHQKATINYQGGAIPAGSTYTTDLKNNFKGAGPLIGLDSNFILPYGFSFFGDVAGAIIYGQFNNTQQQTQITPISLSSNINLFSPMAQMYTGLAWDATFNNDRCHFGVMVGFEAQMWWDQNQTEQFTSVTEPIYVRQKGDLAFYGLTISARFDF